LGRFSADPGRIKLKVGFVSMRRSTKGIQPQDGRTGFGAPHVKPFRPAVPFFHIPPSCGRVAAQGIFLPFSGYKGREIGGRATKLYSAALVLNGVLALFALRSSSGIKSPKRLPPFQE
jgi:hypothetical protein